MEHDLTSIDLARLPLRLRIAAVLIEAGGPLTVDEVLTALERRGASPAGGGSALKRACAGDGCVRRRSDGRLVFDRQHTEAPSVQARISGVRAGQARAAAGRRAARLAGDDTQTSPIPRVDATWLGMRRSMGDRVHAEQETDLLLWLDVTAGQLRAFELRPHGRDAGALAALLETAMQAPLEGCAPAIPRVIACAAGDGSDAVERVAEAHGSERIERDLAPVEAVFEQLKRELTMPAMRLAQYDPVRVRAFYAAAAALRDAAPWSEGKPGEVLGVGGLGEGPLYVLLTASKPSGFVVFFDEASALGLVLRGRPPLQGTLQVQFHAARRMAAAAAAADAYGWTGESVPLPLRVERGESRPVSAADLDLLTQLSGVLAGLDLRQPFQGRVVRLEGQREALCTWPLLASPFGHARHAGADAP